MRTTVRHARSCLSILAVICALTLVAIAPMTHSTVIAQEAAASAAPGEGVIDDDAMEEHFTSFSELLTGSTLVGHFTIPGMKTDKPMHEERYDIRSVKKSERGDYWLFIARIKYGDHDVTVPMPLEVKWAGTTPVITLDSVTIPKLGTFDARVVIDGKQYAGTWRHGEVGGHMFGRIETKADKEATDGAAPAGKEAAAK